MRKAVLLAAGMVMSLAACSEQKDAAAGPNEGASVEAAADAAAEMASADQAAPATGPVARTDGAPDGKVIMPTLSFLHSYRFAVPRDALNQVQQSHVAACEALGRNRCLVSSMSINEERNYGQLSLYVAQDQARPLADRFAIIADEAGGERKSAEITGQEEDAALGQARRDVVQDSEEAKRLAAIAADRRARAKDRAAASAALPQARADAAASQQSLDQVATRIGLVQMTVDYEVAFSWFDIIATLALLAGLVSLAAWGISRADRKRAVQVA